MLGDISCISYSKIRGKIKYDDDDDHDDGQASTYIQELLQPYVPSCNLRLSSKNLLIKPRFKLKSYGKRAFTVAVPELWNKLPEDIKSASSIDCFKNKLKTFLFI